MAEWGGDGWGGDGDGVWAAVQTTGAQRTGLVWGRRAWYGITLCKGIGAHCWIAMNGRF